MDKKLLDKLKKIKLLALDFDGVLTDGYVYINQQGEETVRCSRKDSLGTNILQAIGIYVVVISKEVNPIVEMRCKKMKVDCYYGVQDGKDKLSILKFYALERTISLDEIVYIGDDVNDIECIQAVGVGVTVADGHPDCKAIADYIMKRRGGEHAVREVCDLILKARGGQEHVD